MSETAPDVGRVLDEYEALWNGDDSKLDVVTPDVVVSDPAAPDGELHGRDALAAYLHALHEAFPDFALRTVATLTDGDTVMVEWTMTGTLEREFYGAPPTGRRMEVTGMSTARVRDGRLLEDRLYYNEREVLAQLGLTVPGLLPLAPKLLWGKLTGQW